MYCKGLLSNRGIHLGFDARNMANWPLITNELAKFKKYLIKVHDFMKIIEDFKGYVEYDSN